MLITLKHKKILEKLVKNVYGEKHSLTKWTYVVVPLWGNSNVYQQHMLLKLRKPILKYTLNKYHIMSIGFSLLNISNSQSVLKYLSLYGKFFIFTWQLYHQIWFMNFAFAKLVVTW